MRKSWVHLWIKELLRQLSIFQTAIPRKVSCDSLTTNKVEKQHQLVTQSRHAASLRQIQEFLKKKKKNSKLEMWTFSPPYHPDPAVSACPPESRWDQSSCSIESPSQWAAPEMPGWPLPEVPAFPGWQSVECLWWLQAQFIGCSNPFTAALPSAHLGQTWCLQTTCSFPCWHRDQPRRPKRP